MVKFEKQQQVVARELDALQKQGVVSKFRDQLNDPHWKKKLTLPKGPPPEVTIGVSFRTDSNGKAHSDHDVRGLLAVNDLPGSPCKVKCIALPRGASGGVTPLRNAQAGLDELDGIDLLYIPGAPAAPVSQVATSHDPAKAKEEREFNLKTAPVGARPTAKKAGDNYDKAKREFDEFASRAPYEARLINIARVRGIPVLAICAGSWRLIESYGGKVRTLPLNQRSKHKADQMADTWTLSHGVATKPGTMVGGKSVGVGGSEQRLAGINSTHWAVACIRYNAKRKDFGLEAVNPDVADPDQLLEIAAFATDPLAATVEAFESRYGAPTIGIQWHPESYLPGMLGETQGSAEGRQQARSLFLFIVGAALATKKRRVAVGQSLTRESEAFAALCEAARTASRLASRGDETKTADLVQRALTLVPQTDWTPRMLLIKEAIDLLIESSKAEGPVAAGNAYIGAMSKLKDLGMRL